MGGPTAGLPVRCGEQAGGSVADAVRSTSQSNVYPWTEYLSPKEHFEELQMKQLEQSRRDLELRLSTMEQAAQDQAARSERRFARFLALLAVLAVILAFVQVSGALGWIG